VDVSWCVKSDPGMAMMVIVVINESVHIVLGIGQRAEPFGERMRVFQRLEPSLTVGIVVALSG
jgi:hypothetical protein